MLPSYSDLSKACRDLFSKGYHVGKLNVDTKSNACYGTELSTNTYQVLEDKSITGEVVVKNTWPRFGLVNTNKWSTKNLLTNELTCQDYLLRGLRLGLNGYYNIDTGIKRGSMNANFRAKGTCFNGTGEAVVEGGDEENLVFSASGVGGYKNYLAGCLVQCDTVDGTLKKNNVVFGYLGCGFTGLVGVDNLDTLVGSYHHKVTDRVEAGVQCSSKTKDGTFFAVGGKYIIDPEGTCVRAKVDNKGILGVGCGIKLTEGSKVFFSSDVDLKNFSGGGHKVGLGLEFQ